MKRYLIILLLIIVQLDAVIIKSEAKDVPPKSDLVILLSNDDGYNAPGLKALINALVPIAMVVVAAPSNQQSGAGHGITYRNPIFVRQIHNVYDIPWYAVSARPATCVRLGVESLLKEKPDLVISGINRGENLGIITFYSGTLGAAREAAILDIPAIAVSMRGNNTNDYKQAANYVAQLVNRLVSEKLLHSGLLLNVNVPAGVANGIKGTQVTKLSQKPMKNMYHLLSLPLVKVYVADSEAIIDDNEIETDVYAFSRGYITVTPLSINQTNTVELTAIKSLANKLTQGEYLKSDTISVKKVLARVKK